MINGHVNRACIYFIYDRDGVIDDYIIYQLRDLRKNVSFLHCVINGKLTSSGRLALEKIADEVYIRENKGMDIGAYKAAINYIGWNDLKKYDELILMNNTCFGPVYPFKEVFDWADKQNVDFWGLTWGRKANWFGNTKYLYYTDMETHYQSYFLAIKKNLLASKFIIDFFNNIPEDTSYLLSTSIYEYAFPGYFEENGYKGAVYCDDLEDINYPLLHDPVTLLRKFRMPLFKKRSFFHHYTDVLGNTAGEATRRLIEFIENETDYDMDLVWKSILRTSSLSDLVRCAQLNRVLARDSVNDEGQGGKTKVGFVYHAFYRELFPEVTSYICNFPIGTDVLVTTDTEEKKKELEKLIGRTGRKVTVRLGVNRGRDISALLVGAADFVAKHDLICFAHDKKSTQVKPESVGRSWAYKLHENTVGSPEFVRNVIALFEREDCLGIAFPSPPNHSFYSTSIGNGWSGNFVNTQRFMEDLGVNVKINEHTLCVAPLGTCFWFRPDALKKLFAGYQGHGWSYKDFPREPNRCDQTILHAIERSFAYFAQAEGYYPVYLYSDKYAEIEFTNLEFNKAGSTDMRNWVEALAMNAIGNSNIEQTYNAPINELSDTQVAMYVDQHVNYGVKRSLVHLATALRYKYPRMWKLLLPIRRIGQKILGIKTK